MLVQATIIPILNARANTVTVRIVVKRRISQISGAPADWRRMIITRTINRTEGSMKKALSSLLHRPERRVLTKN